jgi:hypothetical protein
MPNSFFIRGRGQIDRVLEGRPHGWFMPLSLPLRAGQVGVKIEEEADEEED